jgi:putative phosphonate metabolism protein
MFKRYAIYFTPPPGGFSHLATAWLGWDLAQGCTVPHPDIAGIDVATVTERPRKYGLHATIKAPFTLADGATEQDLVDALAAFCAGHPTVTLDGLGLTQIGRFLALTPVGDTSALNRLASEAVRSLDRFRAPLGEAEFNRKNRPNMSDRQRQLLRQWGYPHVEEFFRFHFTLTGPIPDAELAQVRQAIEAYLMPAIPAPFDIDSLTLCGEDADGRFHQVARFGLGKAANSL